MNNLLTAIMTKTTGSALSSAVGGRIFLDDAPQGAEFSYVVFFIVSDVPQDTFTEYLDDVLIQFSIFSASEGATEITTIYNDLIALFDNCALTITSDIHISMMRQNLTTMVEDITTVSGATKVKHWAVDYSVMLTKP
jgi:hypothetical protein